MNKERLDILLESCSRSLLSYQLYIRDKFSDNSNISEFENVLYEKIPRLIKLRLKEYSSSSYVPNDGVTRRDIFKGDINILKALETCFRINQETAERIFNGYTHLGDEGLIVKFTNIENIYGENNKNVNDSNQELKYGCYSLDEELLSKVYDFVLRDQISLLDSIKFMYDNVSIETDISTFGCCMRKICFEGEIWKGGEFNILDELWKWYSTLVDREFIEFNDPIIEEIFGNPLVQCYYRMILESNILHTILVILQSLNMCLSNSSVQEKKSNSGPNETNDSALLSKATLINRCRIIISKLQSNCFLGSLYTLYSDKSGIQINTLSYCDNALAHSTTILDQLRQTSTNGVILACSLVLSLSPKSITKENEDLGFLISIAITFLKSLSSNDSGEIIQEISRDEVLNNNFNTPVRINNLLDKSCKQRFVRGNLILVHAKIIKPLLPGFIFAYASIVAQTPNRDTLLVPIIGENTFFESSAFADSLENMIMSLNSQNPIKQYILINLNSLDEGNNANREKTVLGEHFGTYYQYFVVYGLIRNTISTFSLNVLPFTAKITKTLSKLLRKEPRLVFRECWRGDYFRHIGVHLILEMYISFFPYGIVEFTDLLSSLVPDFNAISKLSRQEKEMAKQALKLFLEFIRNPIKYINFPPYLSSISLIPLEIDNWNLGTIKKEKEALEFPLHVEVSKVEIPNFTSGSSFSQASLLDTVEGCILDFLEIQLGDVTPLSVGFPSARKCLTPLRALSTGVSQRVPLKSLLLENSETTFSCSLWTTSPYGSTYDFPESEMPPYFHIKESVNADLLSQNRKLGEISNFDINSISQPSDLPVDSSEIKLGNLNPFTIQFCCDSEINSNINPGSSIQNVPSPLPSLLKILLLIWDATSLLISQKEGNIINKNHIEMFVSISELIYRFISINRSSILILEQEISNWNALVPTFPNSRIQASSSTRFGILTIKILQSLKALNSLVSNQNSDEFLSHVFYSLPRLIHILNITMRPINYISTEDALHNNFSKLGIDDKANTFYKSNSDVENSSILYPPWTNYNENTVIPMYWLVPLLLSNSGILNFEKCTASEISIIIENGSGGPYTSLLKGIQGFNINEFFNLVTKTIEVVEKQFRSYPISNQVLQFISTLLEYCPVLFWGFGWDRHGKIILNNEFSSNINKNKIKNDLHIKIQKDLQLLLNDFIIFQSVYSEDKRDPFEFFNRVSNFTVHSVLSRIQSWQFNIDSERNILLLSSINTFSLLLDSMNSITLIGDFEEILSEEMEKNIDNSKHKINEDQKGIESNSMNCMSNNIRIGGAFSNEINTLKDIVPSISFITSSNYQSIIVTIFKHLVETSLIPTLLSLLSCQYGINSKAIQKSGYMSYPLNKKDNSVNKSELGAKSGYKSSFPWVLLVSNSTVSHSMTKNESISYNIALHIQHSNSQSILVDRLLFTPLDCRFSIIDNSGELFGLPDVIVAQQVVSKVLEILYIIFNSVSDIKRNSILLKTLRTSLLQWILTSYSKNNTTGVQSMHNQNDDFSTTLEPKFKWSDSDLVSQHIKNKVNKLYQQKKPQMNVIKSLLVTILSYTPSTFPLKASLFASKLLSLFCYILATETDYNKINKNVDLLLEQILKPPVSVNSIQQDFLLYLANTKLFPILNKILFQELDFILLSPIFHFLQVFNASIDKMSVEEEYSIHMVHSIIELLILLAHSHPSIIICSIGSFNYENSVSMIQVCKNYITVNSSVHKSNANSKYTENSRVRLLCLSLSGLLENINVFIENYPSNINCKNNKLTLVTSLLPNIFNLLTQLLEDSRSRDLLIKEMFDTKVKLSFKNISSNSLLEIIVTVTKNLIRLLNNMFKDELKNDSANQHIVLKIITILSSSLTCIYHFVSRIIGITTYISSKNSSEPPFILKNQDMFKFILFLLSDELVHKILYSKQSHNYLLNTFSKSIDHFSLLDQKIPIPIKYCIFNDVDYNTNYKGRFMYIDKNSMVNKDTIRKYNRGPKNSLEEFIRRYYYERYLKFSQLIISNETIHNLTEFNVPQITKFRENTLNENKNGQNPLEINNHTIESVSINNNNTSQLASLEMVWESGQLLAPKQHLSPKTIMYDKNNSLLDSNFPENSQVIYENESEKVITKHSLLTSRSYNYSEPSSDSLKANILNMNSYDSPTILVLRNSSFVYKTNKWGPNYEVDLYSLLILLSCYTAASVSVPHEEMNVEEFLKFSLETFENTKNDNIRRSFIESFMFLLTSYNQLIFYLKSILPVIIVNSRNSIKDSVISEISSIFDNTKLVFLSNCVNLTMEDQFCDDKRLEYCYPNLLRTIIFSTCTDLMTFDLLSSIKLIIGRVEMIETSILMKDLVKQGTKNIKIETENDEPILDISPVAPNSSTVCLFSFWQNQMLNFVTKINDSNPVLKNDKEDNAGIKKSEVGNIVGNLAYFSPLSQFSNKNQRNNFKGLSLLILEQLCKFIIDKLKLILNFDLSEFNVLNNNVSNKTGSKIPTAFDDIWTLRSILENSIIKRKSLNTINKELCSECEIYLSCDIMTSLYLVILIIKQLPDLLDPENTEATELSLLKESKIVLLLELVSSCIQFYNKNGKILQRIANNGDNSETERMFPPFFASSLISVVISSLNIPTYIIETIYSENRKIILQDLPSDFTISPNFCKIPLITRIKTLIDTNPLMHTFNNDVSLKILPLLHSLIQLEHSISERNIFIPVVAHQSSLKEENSINNSFELLKPSRVPFLTWNETAHISLLKSLLSSLVSLSSTTKGCISIIKSNILIQLVTKEFISIFRNANDINSYRTNKQKYSLDVETNDEYSNRETFGSLNKNSLMRLVTYLNVGYDNPKIIRNPMHIIWCEVIFVITRIFDSIAKLKNYNLEFNVNNYSAYGGIEIGGSENIHEHSKLKYKEINDNINSVMKSSLTVSRRPLDTLENEKTTSFNLRNKNPILEEREIFIRDNLQIKESIYKLYQLIDSRVQFVLSDSKYISQLAMLEEFNLTVDLVRSALSLNFCELNSHLVETLRRALRTVRNISVISLGRGITESFDLFKPVSLLEKTSAGHKIESLNIYYLDNHLPGQVPSIFHQRCCTLLLNSIRNIVSTFVSDSNSSFELRGKEPLIQLLHDAMDLGRPILQLLEDVPNHCYSVLIIVNTGKGDPFLPLSLNLQGICPCSPKGNEILNDNKLASLNKNIVEFRGIAKISAISESCYLPEMITLKSFIQLLSSLIEIFAVCGIKCLYKLETLESTDQHNDTVRRFLEFLHLSQGLNSLTLLESSRKLVEIVYNNIKSKLGDQINVEVASLVGIKKDPIHSLLLDRLSNINNSTNN